MLCPKIQHRVTLQENTLIGTLPTTVEINHANPPACILGHTTIIFAVCPGDGTCEHLEVILGMSQDSA